MSYAFPQKRITAKSASNLSEQDYLRRRRCLVRLGQKAIGILLLHYVLIFAFQLCLFVLQIFKGNERVAQLAAPFHEPTITSRLF